MRWHDLIRAGLSDRFDVLATVNYRRYFLRMLLNRTGEGIWYVVSSWTLLRLTGEAYSVALLMTASLLPALILSPFIGIWTDRLSRRSLLAAADLAQGVTLLALAAVLLAGWSSAAAVHLVYAMGIALGVSGQFQQVTVRALVRDIVEPSKLLKANSTTSMAGQAGGLAGPVLGGLIMAGVSETAALLTAAGTALAAAGLTAAMRTPPTAPAGLSDGYPLGRYVRDLGVALRRIGTDAEIRRLFGCLVVFYLSLPTLNFLLPVQMVDALRLDADAFGVVDAVFGVGGIAASFVMPTLVARYGARPVMLGGTLLFALSIALFGRVSVMLHLVPLYFMIGFFFHVGVVFMSEMQARLDSGVQGRVISLFNLSFSILSILFIQAAGLLVTWFGVAGMYATLALFLAAGILAIGGVWLLPGRARPVAPAIAPTAGPGEEGRR